MLGWIIGASGIVLAVTMWLRSRAAPRRPPVALPPSPLVERLSPLLSAMEEVRAAARELTAEDLQLCAPSGIGAEIGTTSLWGLDGPASRVGEGPGRRPFIALHRALAAVDPDDQRTLAEAGFDPARLRSALEPRGAAEPWRQRLLLAFEALEKALAQVRHQPYR